MSYRRGFVARLPVRETLPASVLEGGSLPDAIVDAVHANRLLELPSVLGHPDVGEPIQIDDLEIEHAGGTKRILVYNRAIMLFTTIDDRYVRVHRVCCLIENAVEGWESDRGPDARGGSVRLRSVDAIYQLKVSLRGTKPPIWRRFLVPADISLARLHDVLQVVMGWADSHLHQFEARGVLYGTSDREFGLERVSERKTTLAKLLRRPKDQMSYEYDFGDGWEHEIVLERVLPPEPEGRYPWLLAGKRACPPEDVGGIPGYYNFLEAIANPSHVEHEEMLEWIGGAFDPDEFDVREANLAIHGGWARTGPPADPRLGSARQRASRGHALRRH